MRRTDLLVKEVLRMTENEDAQEEDSGLTKSEVVQYINEAQDRLQSRISRSHPKIFVTENFIDIVADQEAYDLPNDIYMGTRIIMIENKVGSQNTDYRKISSESIFSRNTASSTFSGRFPQFYYMRRGSQVLINPIPASAETNGLRITYEKKLPDLDIRRGLVDSAVLSGISPTSITISVSPSLSKDSILNIDGEAVLNEIDFITVVDRDGVIQMQAIPIDKFDATSGVITMTSGFTAQTGETVVAGNYIVGGKVSTSHSELQDMCERYLITYATSEILKRDTAVELHQLQLIKLREMERDIVDAYRQPDNDLLTLPVHDLWEDDFGIGG